MFLEKAGTKECHFVKVDDLVEWRANGEAEEGKVPTASVTADEWNFVVGSGSALFERLRSMPVKPGDVSSMFVGLQTSADTVFLFKDNQKAHGSLTKVRSNELDQEVELESSLLKPVIRSGSIGRYWARRTALVLFPYKQDNGFRLIPEAEMKSRFPKAWSYL